MANGQKTEYKDFNIGDSNYRQRNGEVFKLDGNKYNSDVSDEVKAQIENYGKPQETSSSNDPLKSKSNSTSSEPDSALSGSSAIANSLTEPNMGNSTEDQSTNGQSKEESAEPSISRTQEPGSQLKTTPSEEVKTMPGFTPGDKPELARAEIETLRKNSPAPFEPIQEAGIQENLRSETQKSEPEPSTYRDGYIDEPFRGESNEEYSENNRQNMTDLEGQEIREQFEDILSDTNLAKLKMTAEFERMSEGVSQTLNNGSNTWASALSGTNLFGSTVQTQAEGNKSFQDLYSAREAVDSNPEIRFHNAAQDLYTQAGNDAQAEILSQTENGKELSGAQKQEIEAEHFKAAFETVIKESMKIESKANDNLETSAKQTQEEQVKTALTRATDTLAKHMIFSPEREAGPVSMINEELIMTDVAKEKALEVAESPEQKEEILKQAQDLAYLSDAMTKHAEIDPASGDYKDAKELYNGMTKLSAANAVRELYDEAKNAGLTDPAEVKNYVNNKMQEKIKEELAAFNNPNDSRYIKSEKMRDYFLTPKGEKYPEAGRYEAYMKTAARSYEKLQSRTEPQEFQRMLQGEKQSYGEYLGMINEAGTMLDAFTTSGDGLAYLTDFR